MNDSTRVREARHCARLGFAVVAALLLGTPALADPLPRPALDSCEHAAATAPTARETWGCFYDHARAHGDWAQTAAVLSAQLARLEAEHPSPSPLTRGYATLGLANVVAELDNEASLGLYETAANELERGGDPLAVAVTLLNLAHRHRVAGQPSRSADDLRRAERAATRLGDARWIATVKVERVRHMMRTGGDLGVAARVLEETEPLLFPAGDYQARVNWLAASTSVQRGLGRLDRARALADRHVALVAGAQDRYAEAMVRHNRLDLMLAQAAQRGDRQPSDALLAEIELAVAVSEAGSNRAAAVSLRVLQSDSLRVRGASEQAEAVARRCLLDAGELGDPRLHNIAALSLLDTILHGGRPLDQARRAEAERLLEEAKARAHRAHDAPSELAVLGAEAELRWLDGATDRALAASESLLAALERLRADQSDPTSRAELQGARADAYESYVDHLLREAQTDPTQRHAWIARALEVGERFRARGLRESLLAKGVRQLPDPGLLDAIAEVQRRLADPSLPAEDRVAALDELEALERRELEGPSNAHEPAPLDVRPLGMAEIQGVLGEREALLVYHLPTPSVLAGARRSGAWVLVLTRSGAEAIELAVPSELVPRVEMFGPLVERREHDIGAAASTLGALLLADAIAVVPESVNALTVVLDGPLHQLPLASLHPGPETGPLIERHSVSVVPSASMLGQWRRHRNEHPRASPDRGVLALADPPARASAAASPGSNPAAERRSSVAEGLVLPPLPLARREAEVAAHLEHDTRWLGTQASEAALGRVDLGRFAVIHFATHAVVDELRPARSAIVLAPDGGDGLLQPREIAGLRLDGTLVVVSACSTARGRVLAGEGVMGLAHAMFEAGAHTVVASLWPLRDDDALALFERFYPYVDAGDDVGTALQKAQRDRAALGAPPAAWAGVVVLGDPSMVPFPGGRAAREPTTTTAPWDRRTVRRAIAIALLLVALGVGVSLRRRG